MLRRGTAIYINPVSPQQTLELFASSYKVAPKELPELYIERIIYETFIVNY